MPGPRFQYLGHQINAEGIHTTQSKLEAIVKVPEPKNLQELHSFLGLLNYYSKYISNLLTIVHPLNCLLQQERMWTWNADCACAFQQSKQILTSLKLLVHYDPLLPLQLAANASAYGLGAVISHVMSDGTERPTVYASRTLNRIMPNWKKKSWHSSSELRNSTSICLAKSLCQLLTTNR